MTKDYSLYLRIDAVSNPEDLHRWSGVIQTRLQVLLISLQKVENLSFRLLPIVFKVDDTSEATIIGLRYKKPKGHAIEDQVKENGKGKALTSLAGTSGQTHQGVLEESKLNGKSPL